MHTTTTISRIPTWKFSLFTGGFVRKFHLNCQKATQGAHTIINSNHDFESGASGRKALEEGCTCTAICGGIGTGDGTGRGLDASSAMAIVKNCSEVCRTGKGGRGTSHVSRNAPHAHSIAFSSVWQIRLPRTRPSCFCLHFLGCISSFRVASTSSHSSL